MAEWTADQIVKAIALAVKEHDFEAVVSLLKMLALKDPHQAELVYGSMLAVLDAGGRWLSDTPAPDTGPA